MFKKLRFTIIWILAIALLVSFAGCSGNDSDEEENGPSSSANPVPEDLAGNITISAYKNYENDNDLFMFAQAYALQYPSVDVQIDADYSYDEYFATLDERIESGEIGDVVLISSEQLPEYVEKGWILDLSSDAEGIIDYTSASFDRLYPSEEYMEAAYNASLYEGRMYMCPVEYLNQVVILNLDLLEAAGIEDPVPSDDWTWDELYDMMSVLQNKKLEVGLPVGLPGLQVFLYQQGIDLYTDDGWRTNLDSHEALSAFDTYAGFFRKYSSPVAWDTSRFRTGEIPVMMSSNGAAATANQSAVSFYNELMNYVELRGLWEIAPMLATVVENDDGTLSQNWSSVVLVTGMIIPRGSNNPESSWKYLKWYVSSDTQERMRNETIAVSPLPTTKYNTANTKVFLNQPWTASEYAAVSKQMKQLCGITEYPGHYIVPTYVKNAFMDVYNRGADASNAMLDRIYDINREISRKRQEFGMDAYDISYSGVDYTKKTGSETTDGE